MASKSVKVIKVPGAKAPKLQSAFPKVPKLPQLASNLASYAPKPFLPKTKGL